MEEGGFSLQYSHFAIIFQWNISTYFYQIKQINSYTTLARWHFWSNLVCWHCHWICNTGSQKCKCNVGKGTVGEISKAWLGIFICSIELGFHFLIVWFKKNGPISRMNGKVTLVVGMRLTQSSKTCIFYFAQDLYWTSCKLHCSIWYSITTQIQWLTNNSLSGISRDNSSLLQRLLKNPGHKMSHQCNATPS